MARKPETIADVRKKLAEERQLRKAAEEQAAVDRKALEDALRVIEENKRVIKSSNQRAVSAEERAVKAHEEVKRVTSERDRFGVRLLRRIIAEEETP